MTGTFRKLSRDPAWNMFPLQNLHRSGTEHGSLFITKPSQILLFSQIREGFISILEEYFTLEGYFTALLQKRHAFDFRKF